MTLLDAPEFDEAPSKRRRLIAQLSAAALFVLLVIYWLVASRPVDWPWYWQRYIFGRADVNKFMVALEANDLNKAYGVWMNDPNWQHHAAQYSTYPFARFEGDWGPSSPDNEYGPIRSHTIAMTGSYGNGLLVAVLVNGRKSDALNLDYDPRTGQLSFAPPGVSLCLPGSTDPGCQRH